MNKKIYNHILITLILFLITGFAHAEMTTSEIAKKYSASVVTIVALDENDQPLSLGSGFFINESGDIATNHHVLEGSSKAIIKTIRGDKGNILEIIKDDPELDLLVAKTSFKKTTPLPLGDSNTITVGEDIVAIGNPAGLEGTVSKGIISGIRKVEDFKFIQITAPISPGSSGGPVFNLSGKVIGIATAYLDSGQNLNFAMPINYLNSLRVNRIKLTSLKKTTVKKNVENTSLVKVIDTHYNRCYGTSSLCSIDFSLQNDNSYPIKNVMLFFVYKKHHSEYPEGFLELTQKLLSEGRYDEYHKEWDKVKPIKEWDEFISYSAFKIKNTILSKLGLQFSNPHLVKYFYSERSPYHPVASVEIRILDYEIVRTPRTSPEVLFLK